MTFDAGARDTPPRIPPCGALPRLRIVSFDMTRYDMMRLKSIRCPYLARISQVTASPDA